MTKREKLIMDIAAEIDGLLADGIQIQPNSFIHERLSKALRQFAGPRNRPTYRSSKKAVTPNRFSPWHDAIKRI